MKALPPKPLHPERSAAERELGARYRESLRHPKLVARGKPLEYRFDFPFVARRMVKGSRLRLVLAPVNSIYLQRNFNSGGVVALETARDARTVTALSRRATSQRDARAARRDG